MSRKPSTPLSRLLAGLLLLVALTIGLGAPRAHAAEAVAKYEVKGDIAADGTVSVKAAITFDGAAPATLVQKFATTEDAVGDRRYTFALSDVAATAGGRPLESRVTQEGEQTVVTLTTQGVTGPVELAYSVKGAARKETSGETTVTWRLLQGLSLPVREFTADLTTPAMIQLVDCEAGPPTAPGACSFFGGGTHEHPTPFFSDGPRGVGEIVEITVRFPAGAVAANEQVSQLWTLGRAFGTGPAELGAALVLLALGGLAFWSLHRRIGRDASATGDPILVAAFHPVGEGQSEFRVLGGLRPGQVGTLADERVDPIDVTASLIDLAVRGHLRIEELPRESTYAQADWSFTRLHGADELAGYERTLLDAVAPVGGEPVRVSAISAAVGGVIGTVQDQLYDDVVHRGWFVRRPDQTRTSWSRMAVAGLVAAVVATVLLAAVSSFGLVGLALIVLALLAMYLGQEMPSRTATGVGVLNGLGLLRAQLMGQPTDQMPKGRELSELSELLPYAVVLGGHSRWLQALVDADGDDTADSTDLDWYHAPADWHLRDLPASLENFITTVQGRLFSR